MIRKRMGSVAGLAAAIAMLAQPVGAATATQNLGVKMTLQNTCTVTTPSLLDFGIWSVLSANIDTTQTLSVTCTNLTPYSVGLGPGTGLLAALTGRKMSGALPIFVVNYALYRNAARTQTWGNTVGFNTFPGTGTGTPQALTIYGRVPAQSTPPNGTYTDTVAVTVTY